MIKDIVPKDLLIEALDSLDYTISRVDRKIHSLGLDDNPIGLDTYAAQALAELHSSVVELNRLHREVTALLDQDESENHWENVSNAIDISIDVTEGLLITAINFLKLGKEYATKIN